MREPIQVTNNYVCYFDKKSIPFLWNTPLNADNFDAMQRGLITMFSIELPDISFPMLALKVHLSSLRILRISHLFVIFIKR